MSQFFDMGGYAAFVWPAYAASALVLGVLIALTLSRAAKARRRLEELEKRRREKADG